MTRAANRDIYGSASISGHRIPAKAALPASIHLMARGIPQCDPRETLHVVIGVSDEEGREQRVKIPLRSMAPTAPTEPPIPLEPAFSIADPIEKQIVSVLQAELGRYDKLGREKGGFGSVHLVYQNRAMSSFAGDSWTDSPKNQSIVEDPDAAQLRSDHLEALSGLYGRLTTEEERARFVAALLDRLDMTKGYARIAYFIVCVLMRIRHLGDALTKARASLIEDEQKDFALSNVLYLLNGLLRYRHPEFTAEMLDQTETFVHLLTKEHTFRVAEKVAAIRTYRVLQQTAPS